MSSIFTSRTSRIFSGANSQVSFGKILPHFIHVLVLSMFRVGSLFTLK